MYVKEFRDIFGNDKNIKYFDQNEKDISDKPQEELDSLLVIGSEHCPDNCINVDVLCI